VSGSGSRVIERAVGESRQRPRRHFEHMKDNNCYSCLLLFISETTRALPNMNSLCKRPNRDF